jgi:hypothetical protein
MPIEPPVAISIISLPLASLLAVLLHALYFALQEG